MHAITRLSSSFKGGYIYNTLRLVLVLAVFGALSAAFGQTYDAYQGYSGTQNPNGVWTYGWSTALGGALTVYPNSFVSEGATNWSDYSIESSGDPNVVGVPADDVGKDVPADTMAFSPGPENQFSSCRFTAPAAGVYNIQASFTALGTGAPHVYILHNGASLDDQLLTQGVLWSGSASSVSLAQGDTVDVVIGVGLDGFFASDETTFTFDVTLVSATNPPPPPPQTGPVYAAGAGFSGTQNPNGVWTYAWSTNLAGPLTPYPDAELVGTATNWLDTSIEGSGDPNIAFNPPNAPAGEFPPNIMAFAPGPGSQFSHLLFTAPAAGTYTVQGTFSATSFGEPHVYILKNGVDIADGLLSVGSPWSPTASDVSLALGDTIDTVIGVGPDGNYLDDEAIFNLTITEGAPTLSGTLAKGLYTGLLTGTSGPGDFDGLLVAHVQATGAFTAVLNFGGKRLPFSGIFSSSSTWSGTVNLKSGAVLTLAFGFDSKGKLTGTVTDGSASFLVTAGIVSNKVSAAGTYPFTITPGSAANVPDGTGYGFMFVRTSGAATLVGQLSDGTGFTSASMVTSGSSVPVYANPYGLPGGGLAGTIYFQAVPHVSDCSGTLYWTRPVTQAAVPYADGFAASASLLADQLNPVITGLNKGHDRDQVSLVASGADLSGNFSATVTLSPRGGVTSILAGAAPDVQITIDLLTDSFYGSLVDSTTHVTRDFAGVLLPENRTGAGYFLSNGLSGSVNISY